jgi:serine/threonine protein kinase
MEGVESVRFGRYDVLRPIGEGGMARVYLCVQRGVGRFEKRVVVKVLHPRLAGNAEAIRMFLEEARVMARLHHPNIAAVFEMETVGGVPYIALEYVDGPTLGKLYRHVGRPGPETLGCFVQLMRQVCEGLDHAHTLMVDGRPVGIVHRDVSSQNIVIDAKTGLAKLIDFGIAKALDADQHTQHGILKGRLHYIAPEVLLGARPDARADLYAVGVMLHRMVYGQMPYRDHELMGPRSPLQLGNLSLRGSELWIPEGLPEVIVRALHPEPDLRFSTAEELGSALQELSDRLGVQQQHIPPLVARVFPRGEEDWQQEAPPDVPPVPWPAGTAQAAAQSGTWPAEPPEQVPPRLLYAALGAALVLLVSAAAFAGFVLAAIVSRP